jgi:hypothetical protein
MYISANIDTITISKFEAGQKVSTILIQVNYYYPVMLFELILQKENIGYSIILFEKFRFIRNCI